MTHFDGNCNFAQLKTKIWLEKLHSFYGFSERTDQIVDWKEEKAYCLTKAFISLGDATRFVKL